MWTLPIPDAANSIDELATALTYVNGVPVHPLTDLDKNIVGALYNRYDELLGQPHGDLVAPTLDRALKAAIANAYGEVQDGRRLHNLRERLKIAADRCPFCGIGPVSDLDHHLPQSRYPVIAVYSRNLVPSCHTCNNKKRAAAGAAPTAQFVQAYFDQIPDERFLFADVTVGQTAISFDFRVERSDGMALDVFERIDFQVRRLGLGDRFATEANVFLGALETSLNDAYGTDHDPARVSDFLVRSARSSERRFGLNDWRTALQHGLAESDDFCAGGFRRLYE